MPNFMLLATSWGSKHGGINAFNMDFAIGLANQLGDTGKVFCAVFSPSADDVANAHKKQIQLVSVSRPDDSAAYDPSWAHDVWKSFKEGYPGQQIDWWVGHDVTTGWAATEGPTIAGHGQSTLIMHMTYADYQNYKGGIGQRAHEKENQQRQLFKKGNRHFANGPLLRDALTDIVGRNGSVTMLVPGFADVPVQPSSHRLHLITFGRMDRESDRIKQGALAVAGFASAVKQVYSIPGMPASLKNNPQMRVVGIKEPGGDEEHALARLAAEKAGRELTLIALPFDENRSVLLDELGRANIALMLSWHEGFGLTGWEAVAGEVPLIISEQTGLWQLLKETFGERLARGYVRTVDVHGQRGNDIVANFLPEDEDAVRDEIIDCAANLEKARVDAAKLKDELKRKWNCTWEHTAKQFCDALGITTAKAEVSSKAETGLPPQRVNPPDIRSDFVAIPELRWPKELSDKGFEMPDSMLLRPESRIVRFHKLREPLRDAIIEWAVEGDAPIKLRLHAGEGGAGKTRLLIEVCDRLERLYGWRAGFVDSSQSISSSFPKLLAEGKPTLLVLDYAESRTAEIVALTRVALHSSHIPNVRIVLLARDGGDWWDRLADAVGTDQTASAVLRGLTTKTGPYRMAQENIAEWDRGTIFNQALEDFAAFKKTPVPVIVLPDLSAGLFKNPLFVHLSALASLRGQNSLDDKELLGLALGHERSYWRKLLKDAGLPEQFLPSLEHAIALLTLSGGRRTANEAKALLARSPQLHQLEAPERIGLFNTLRRLYPHPTETGLAALEPDLLGETLVSEVFAKGDDLLGAALGAEHISANIRYVLTVLTRLARRSLKDQRWLEMALERYLAKVAEDALHVGLETGSPISEVLAKAIEAAEPQTRRRVVDILRTKLPQETANLKILNVEVRRQEKVFLERKTSGSDAKRGIALFNTLHLLSTAYKDAGELSKAADAAEEAMTIAERVFGYQNELDRNNLGVAFNRLGNAQRDAGRIEESLESAKRAEAIFNGLASHNPKKYSENWANSLNNLANGLDDTGHYKEALQVVEKYAAFFRSDARKKSKGLSSDLGNALGNLGIKLSRVGRLEEALDFAKQSEAIYRELAKQEPDIHLDSLARVTVTLAHAQRDCGFYETAAETAADAEEIWRDLAEKQPDAYSKNWGDALRALAGMFRLLGNFDKALEKAEQSEAILREAAEKQPAAHSSSWAMSLDLIASSLSDVGLFDRALKIAEQAERIRRKLAEAQPTAYSSLWASSLSNVGYHLRLVGRFEEALEKAEQCVTIRRKLVEEQPNSYIAELTTALTNLADALLSVEKPKSALDIAEEAILIVRPLYDAYPLVHGPWLGFAYRIASSSYLKLGEPKEALVEARRSTDIWTETANVHQNFESVQVAKAFYTLFLCQVAVCDKIASIETLRAAFNILAKPLTDNPKPLRAILSEFLDRALLIDADSTIQAVPTRLMAIVRG